MVPHGGGIKSKASRSQPVEELWKEVTENTKAQRLGML